MTLIFLQFLKETKAVGMFQNMGFIGCTEECMLHEVWGSYFNASRKHGTSVVGMSCQKGSIIKVQFTVQL